MRVGLTRLAAAGAFCLALGACAQDAPGPSAPPPGMMHASAALTGPSGREVEVLVADIPPGDRILEIELIGPAGARYPAGQTTPSIRESGAGRGGTTIGIGVRGGSSSGIDPYISMGIPLLGGGEARRSRRVLARVPIPDPAAFLERPQDWRIGVTFLDQLGERRSLVFPARPRD